jgi:hypothetical protein
MNITNFRWGTEVEMADIDTRKPAPPGCSYSDREYTVVNSNGVGTDPNPPGSKDYIYGGELITLPVADGGEVVNRIMSIYDTFPEGKFNHRTDFHVHVSWEGIADDLEAVKRVLTYNQKYGMEAIQHIWPRDEATLAKMDAGTRRFWTYDFSIVPDWKFQRMMEASNIEEFRQAHALSRDGSVVNYRSVTRHALNSYSLHKHGTLEFRHFFPSKDRRLVTNCIKYCYLFVTNAVSDEPLPVMDLINKYKLTFPTNEELKYNHELEMGWRATNFGARTRKEALAAINARLSQGDMFS